MKLRYSMCYFVLVLVIAITFTNAGIAYSQNKNPVLEQAEKSLQAKFTSSSSTLVQNPQNPSVVQDIHGTSTVKDVYLTWVIISSDNELSINLRYVGDGTTPPISIAATAISKNKTMKGNTDLDSGWISPSTVTVNLNGESTLYDSTSINVVASTLGSSISLPSTATEKPQTSLMMAVPPNGNIWTRIQVTPDDTTEDYYYIPPNSLFNFKAGDHLCPASPCEQEIFDGVLRKVSSFPNELLFSGTLKIIDKSVAGNPEIKNWLYYPFDGDFLIKSTKENTKTGNTVETFVGDLGFDRDKLHSGLGDTHDIQYSVTGTFESPSKILTLVGRLK